MPHKSEGPFSPVNEGETRERERVIEFSPAEVLAVLRSEKFIRALTIAAEETNQSGYETKFRVMVAKNKDFFIDEVEVGGTEAVGGPDHSTAVLQHIDTSMPGETGMLIHFHFHPEPSGPICPSETDLLTTMVHFQSGIAAVGQVGEGGDYVDLLLMVPEKRTAMVGSDFDGFNDDPAVDFAGTTGKQSEVKAVLEKYHLKSEVIRYQKKEEGYTLKQNVASKLRSIGKVRFPVKKDLF